jgi:polysaccharide biosynthesis transport protein
MDVNLQLPNSGPSGHSGNSSNLNKIHETSAKFQRYKILLRRRWWFLLLTASIGVCFQALSITGKPETFVSLAKLVAGGRLVGNQGGAASYVEHLQDFYGTIIETLESAEMRRRALERVRALNPDLKEAQVEIKVTQNKGSAIFNVAAIGAEPKYTRTFLDALLDEFKSFRDQARELQKNKALVTMADDVARKEGDWKTAQERLTAFTKANDMVVVSQGHNQAAEVLRQRGVEMDSLKLQAMEARSTIAGVDAAIQQRQRTAELPAAPTTGNKGSEGGARTHLGFTPTEGSYVDTKRDILVETASRDQLLKIMKPEHPDVLAIEEKISRLKTLLQTLDIQIQEEMKSQLAGLENRIKVLESTMAEQQLAAKTAASTIAEYEKQKKDAELAEAHYREMFEKVKQFQMTEDMTSDSISIMEKAAAPVPNIEDPLMPILMGLAVGLALGVMILLLFDRLDDRMNSFSEFQALFPNEQILGQIPEQRQRGDVALLRANDDRHLYAEAFRNVRSSILFKAWKGKPPKTILLTSAVPNEGKTTVTSNLAITMALAGARVLLADCDLRRGGVSELFKLPVTPGLSEVLRGKTHWRDAVQETNTRNLDLLARGEVFDQTSEMLLSRTTDEILKEMSEEYDYVIFDSAPVLVADDTASFAPKLDTVLFVVRMSSTMARLSGKAMELLYNRQVPMGGVILNRSSSSLKEYTYYNYASYYYTPKPVTPGAETK